MKYGFVEGKNGFNCVSCGTHRRWTSLRHVIRQHENPPEGVRAGSREPSSLDVAVTTERVLWTNGRRPAAVHQSLPPPALPAVAVPTSAFRARGSSVAPAISPAGMADGGSGDADTSNTGPAWAASEANLRDHAVGLRKRRGC